MSARDEITLRDAVEATLLFHAGGEWDNAKRLRWLRLTGRNDATTRALCDTARDAIANAEACLARNGL